MVVLLLIHLLSAIIFYVVIRLMAIKLYETWTLGDRCYVIGVSLIPIFNVIIFIGTLVILLTERVNWNREVKW